MKHFSCCALVWSPLSATHVYVETSHVCLDITFTMFTFLPFGVTFSSLTQLLVLCDFFL